MMTDILVLDKASDWEECVRKAGGLLVDANLATESYIAAMIDNIKQYGFYIVLSEGFAMPHARPECGALGTGASLLKLNTPVMFGNHKVQVVVALAAKDSSSHIELLEQIAALAEQEHVAAISDMVDKRQILTYINHLWEEKRA